MAESTQDQIADLLEEGLCHYGEGRMEQAAECWREVLRLEPGHPGAEDYLRTAGFDTGGTDAPGASGEEESAEIDLFEASGEEDSAEIDLFEASGEEESGLLADALELFRKGEAEESLELFGTLARENPRRLEIQGYLELVRSHLFKYYRERVAGASAVLRVRITPQEIMRFNLPANAGFVLSMVDGHTSVNEILTLSGMDPFDAVRVVGKLVDAGIVEVNP